MQLIIQCVFHKVEVRNDLCYDSGLCHWNICTVSLSVCAPTSYRSYFLQFDSSFAHENEIWSFLFFCKYSFLIILCLFSDIFGGFPSLSLEWLFKEVKGHKHMLRWWLLTLLNNHQSLQGLKMKWVWWSHTI